MLGGGVALALRGKLQLLQLRVGSHAALGIGMCQLKDAMVEGMEACQGDELECISQLAKLLHSIQGRPSDTDSTTCLV